MKKPKLKKGKSHAMKNKSWWVIDAPGGYVLDGTWLRPVKVFVYPDGQGYYATRREALAAIRRIQKALVG